MKWEYRVEPLFLEGTGIMAQDMLNEFGKEGWEAIGFVPNSVGKDIPIPPSSLSGRSPKIRTRTIPTSACKANYLG